MSSGLILIVAGVAVVVVLLLTATVNLALRILSRSRMEEKLRRRNREHRMDELMARRSDLAVAAATLRTAATLALVMVALAACRVFGVVDLAWQYVIAFVALMILVFVFGVAVPLAWAKYGGESLLSVLMPVLMACHTLFRPLILVLRWIDDLVRRLADVPADGEGDAAVRHEQQLLDAVSEGELYGAVDEEMKEMIESVMELRDSRVAEIMTPRTEIQAVRKDAELEDIKNLIQTIGHSRIPVFEDTVDNVVGIVYAKDLLQLDKQKAFDVMQVMRAPVYIPETKNLRDLLHEFQASKVHMAIVLDEYGGTAGLVTLEDLLEELVGEITDEYDVEKPEPIVHIDDESVEIDARVRIDEINEELDLQLPEDESYETLGGFVFSQMGRIPGTGESFTHDNVKIDVIDAEPRRVNRLRISVVKRAHPTEYTP